MGLTAFSTGFEVARNRTEDFDDSEKKIIALAGNPNVGKSTVFNALTGLKQHTGNWPGKTVESARGEYTHQKNDYVVYDLPGTYSIMASSAEEEVARDFICFYPHDLTVVVIDATCIERNLNLVLQILEANPKTLVCLNLIDEAKRNGITIDIERLSQNLGCRVIATNARDGKGLDALKKAISSLTESDGAIISYSPVSYKPYIQRAVDCLLPYCAKLSAGKLNASWLALKILDFDESFNISLKIHLNENNIDETLLDKAVQAARTYLEDNNIDENTLHDDIVSQIVLHAEELYLSCVQRTSAAKSSSRKIDKYVLSKSVGIPLMILLMCVVFYLTITGANYPSELLSALFGKIETVLLAFFVRLNAPSWLTSMLVEGVWRTLGWVVSVMLPPMAIFFPLFTLLEDMGYLPRIAFMLDPYFKKAGAHGKQALTTMMGFGCNACGVIGCRIIDSPRERLIATLTNCFVPCNGKFPAMIAIITLFFTPASLASGVSTALSALLLTALILLGIFITFGASKLLSKTLLKGVSSSFVLELPPYRKPQVGKVIVRSIFDRTLFVLGRAVMVAAPAGLIIWLLSNLTVGGASLLTHAAGFLDPFARVIGLDGIILLAFILGFPANEIVIPLIVMGYMAQGALTEISTMQLGTILVQNGWTWITALCVLLFSLLHFPCATTMLTIKKETGSVKWTLAAFFIPLLAGIIICFAVNMIATQFIF